MRSRWLLLLVPLVAWFAPDAATAQHYTSNLHLKRVHGADAKLSDRLSVFMVVDYGYMDWDVSFDVASKTEDEDGEVSSQQLVFDATGMRVTQLAPQIGLSYAMSETLLLTAGAGVSMISLEERLVSIPGSLYGNEHAAIFSYDLEPGLAANVGGLFQLAKFADFTLTGGLRLAYTSSDHVENEAVNGSQTAGDAEREIKEESLQDVSLHLLTIRANGGLEWRPRGSYFSNHFGATLGYGYSFGAMTKAYKLENVVGGTQELESVSDTVGFGMTPSRVFGLYYGWTVFLPEVGNLGFELHGLDQFSGSLQYEYLF